jgi:hypothetical protein
VSPLLWVFARDEARRNTGSQMGRQRHISSAQPLSSGGRPRAGSSPSSSTPLRVNLTVPRPTIG